jgi:hypothetical protein
MEVDWVQKRFHLWQLLQQHPDWTGERLAQTVGMSLSWVCKWKGRLINEDGHDITAFLSRSRQRKTSPRKVSEAVEAKILYLRDYLTERYQRRVGARNILYHLQQDSDLQHLGAYIPRAHSTVHDVLVRYDRIPRPSPRIHVPREPAEPMQVWEMDFTDVVTAKSPESGKRQHQVEVLNVVDTGTSLLLHSTVSDHFDAEWSLVTLVDMLRSSGCPRVLRFDRDSRFVASWSMDKFPSALMRFLLCVGIQPDVCPPNRPDLKPYVERFNRTQKEECIYPKSPTTVTETQLLLLDHGSFYNLERPNQAVTCGNRPPSEAAGNVPPLPRLPARVDPDAWLKSYHRQIFRRKVGGNGSVAVDTQRYYIGKRYVRKRVALQVDATTGQFDVWLGKQHVKSLPVRHLYKGEMSFDDYVEYMIVAARSEEKRLQLKRRRMSRAN